MPAEVATNKPATQGERTQKMQPRKRQKKISEYGQQLIEKQKTRNAYGLREEQFRGYFSQANKFRGQTGTVLLQLLERRLDNVIFRAGLAKTRAQARQLISHRHFSLNGQRVNIASIMVKKDDAIEKVKKSGFEFTPENKPAEWLKVEQKSGKVTVERLPETADLPIEFDTQKIIEFYSR